MSACDCSLPFDGALTEAIFPVRAPFLPAAAKSSRRPRALGLHTDPGRCQLLCSKAAHDIDPMDQCIVDALSTELDCSSSIQNNGKVRHTFSQGERMKVKRVSLESWRETGGPDRPGWCADLPRWVDPVVANTKALRVAKRLDEPLPSSHGLVVSTIVNKYVQKEPSAPAIALCQEFAAAAVESTTVVTMRQSILPFEHRDDELAWHQVSETRPHTIVPTGDEEVSLPRDMPTSMFVAPILPPGPMPHTRRPHARPTTTCQCA